MHIYFLSWLLHQHVTHYSGINSTHLTIIQIILSLNSLRIFFRKKFWKEALIQCIDVHQGIQNKTNIYCTVICLLLLLAVNFKIESCSNLTCDSESVTKLSLSCSEFTKDLCNGACLYATCDDKNKSQTTYISSHEITILSY